MVLRTKPERKSGMSPSTAPEREARRYKDHCRERDDSSGKQDLVWHQAIVNNISSFATLSSFQSLHNVQSVVLLRAQGYQCYLPCAGQLTLVAFPGHPFDTMSGISLIKLVPLTDRLVPSFEEVLCFRCRYNTATKAQVLDIA